jgi:ABC-type sugar transport system permease subunit
MLSEALAPALIAAHVLSPLRYVVASLVPVAVNPVVAGNPVQFVSVPDVGVPNIGVIKVGLVPNTNAPLPVSSDIAVFNSAEVPVNVLSVNEIVLFANVLVDVCVNEPVSDRSSLAYVANTPDSAPV